MTLSSLSVWVGWGILLAGLVGRGEEEEEEVDVEVQILSQHSNHSSYPSLFVQRKLSRAQLNKIPSESQVRRK